MFNVQSRVIGTLVILLGVSACTVNFSNIPIIVVSTSGSVMKGKFYPRDDFTSEFTMVEAETEVVCKGEITRTGVGDMSCTDDRFYEIAIPRYPSAHGSYVATYNKAGKLVDADIATEMVAVGYGGKADISVLREMLQSLQ